MLLRMLREPNTGRPAPLARLLALLLLVGLVGFSTPVVQVMARWLLGLL